MRAGFGSILVEPASAYDLSGYVARENTGKGTHDPVRLSACYVEAGEAALIVSAGVLGFMPDHASSLRQRTYLRLRQERLFGSCCIVADAGGVS